MEITNYARSAPKISDRGGGPMPPWGGGTQNFGDGGERSSWGGGTTPGWGRVPPPPPPILDNPVPLLKTLISSLLYMAEYPEDMRFFYVFLSLFSIIKRSNLVNLPSMVCHQVFPLECVWQKVLFRTKILEPSSNTNQQAQQHLKTVL